MVKIDMLGFKISNLSIVNDIDEKGLVKLRQFFKFDIEFDQDGEEVCGILKERIELDGHPEQFQIELTIQGIFHVTGVKNVSDKKTVYLKTYDWMFPYADQIIAYLSMDSGFFRLRLQKNELDRKSIHLGERPESKSEKILELKVDEE